MFPNRYRTHISSQLGLKLKNQKVIVAGWVHNIRNHGKLIFIDLRDHMGITQCITKLDHCTFVTAQNLSLESVIQIQGTVIPRSPSNINSDIVTGHIELKIDAINKISESQPLPFPINMEADYPEDMRMKYRFMDLRRPSIQQQMQIKPLVTKYVRDFLHGCEFVEYETPLFTGSNAEGARNFIVPSRLNPGEFYTIVESPQLYKQLLMSSGIPKYFQIAPCARDEDLRAERSMWFTQLDMEMSFVDQEEILQLTENLLVELLTKLNKKLKSQPFPRLSYSDVIAKYGTDKPDLRSKQDIQEGVLSFCWITDFPMYYWNEETESFDFFHNPFSLPQNIDVKDPKKILAHQYDIVCNGIEIGSGAMRNYKPDMMLKVFGIAGYSEDKVKKEFECLWKAFNLGTPPHGGIAIGVDRLCMLLAQVENLREITLFPHNQKGRDLLMNAPRPIPLKNLRELYISTTKKSQE